MTAVTEAMTVERMRELLAYAADRAERLATRAHGIGAPLSVALHDGAAAAYREALAMLSELEGPTSTEESPCPQPR